MFVGTNEYEYNVSRSLTEEERESLKNDIKNLFLYLKEKEDVVCTENGC